MPPDDHPAATRQSPDRRSESRQLHYFIDKLRYQHYCCHLCLSLILWYQSARVDELPLQEPTRDPFQHSGNNRFDHALLHLASKRGLSGLPRLDLERRSVLRATRQWFHPFSEGVRFSQWRGEPLYGVSHCRSGRYGSCSNPYMLCQVHGNLPAEQGLD